MNVVKIDSKKLLKEFIKVPFDLYKDDKYWVAPLISDSLKHLDTKINPFFEYAEAEYFIVVDGKKVLGRISAHTNPNHNKFHNDKKGFFGFFDCIDNQEVANLLLLKAEEWLKSKGCEIISGPFNFNTNDECGLLVEGFESSPFVMMPHNYSYYAKLLENYGLEKSMDLYAWLLETDTMPKFLDDLAKRVIKNDNIKVRCLDKNNLRNDIETVFSIYQKAWEKNWGFVPMSKKEFDNLVSTLLPIVDPELVFIAEYNGIPSGFSVALPNYNFLLHKINGRRDPISIIKLLYYKNRITSMRIITLGVVHEFQGKGIDTLFYYHTWKTGLDKHYNKGEFSWVLENNGMMNSIAKRLGAKVHKVYRIYEKKVS